MRKILLSYGSGAFASFILFGVAWILDRAQFFHAGIFSYRLDSLALLLSWGGAWGLVALFPGLSKLHWLQAGLLMAIFPVLAYVVWLRSGSLSVHTLMGCGGELLWGCMASWILTRSA